MAAMSRDCEPTGKFLFTLFASLAHAYHYLMKPIKLNIWILRERNSVSHLRNFHPGVPNSLEGIFFEKLLAFQRMFELMATQ